MNFTEAIEYSLSKLISSCWKKDREKQLKEYVFVYLRRWSEVLRDPDRLRKLLLDLSKKNRMTKFLFYKEWASQQIWLGKERASQQICIGQCWKQSSIDEGLLRTALLFSAVGFDFGSQCYLINRALQN